MFSCLKGEPICESHFHALTPNNILELVLISVGDGLKLFAPFYNSTIILILLNEGFVMGNSSKCKQSEMSSFGLVTVE